MQVAEGRLAHAEDGFRMRHQRPVRRRNIAVLERVFPERQQGFRIFCHVEAAHGARMTRIERLLQCLGARAALYGEFHCGLMNLQIRRVLPVEIRKLRHEFSKLVRAQACADDRAMQM